MIKVHIRKNNIGMWNLTSKVISIDGVLGMPASYGLQSQFDAVLWLIKHVNSATQTSSAHLFVALQVSSNIHPDDELDIEIDVPYQTWGTLPTVKFQVLKSALSSNLSPLEESESKDEDEATPKKVDLLRLMSDILGSV